MEYMRQSEKFWETFILPEIAFSCFRFALLSSWPKFWMDQFFWENCAGTPVQNFPTILKTLKMMRMIIIRCCCICFLWLCFCAFLADIKFRVLCMIVCFIMRWCNAPQSCLPFLLSPNFRSGYMCAASLQSTVLTFTFSTPAFIFVCLFLFFFGGGLFAYFFISVGKSNAASWNWYFI